MDPSFGANVEGSFLSTLRFKLLWFLMSLYFFHWSRVDLQCCVIFRYTAKWIIYIYIYTIFIFFSFIGYFKILNIVPCVIRYVLLVICFTYSSAAAAAAESLQSCPTLCDPRDGSPPGSPVPGLLQARTLEWVAISFSSARKWKVKVKLLSRVRLLATPWTAAHQAPPSMGFSRQEYWSGVPLPSPIYSTAYMLIPNSWFIPPHLFLW